MFAKFPELVTDAVAFAIKLQAEDKAAAADFLNRAMDAALDSLMPPPAPDAYAVKGEGGLWTDAHIYNFGAQLQQYLWRLSHAPNPTDYRRHMREYLWKRAYGMGAWFHGEPAQMGQDSPIAAGILWAALCDVTWGEPFRNETPPSRIARSATSLAGSPFRRPTPDDL
ncbi:MAG: hypothetical protein NTW87_36530 [Planctomycetota bacterium]|nr:hypothetical protein [Planctomycetota bacterium]